MPRVERMTVTVAGACGHSRRRQLEYLRGRWRAVYLRGDCETCDKAADASAKQLTEMLGAEAGDLLTKTPPPIERKRG